MAIGSDQDVVHEARKAIKRMRALARLFRDELGEPEFKRVSASLRDAAQRLAGARDAQVRLATLTSLAERHPKALSRPGIDFWACAWSASAHRAGSRPTSPRCSRTSPRCASSWRAGTCSSATSRTLAPGLRRVYREGRQRYVHVMSEQPAPTPKRTCARRSGRARLAQARQEPLLRPGHARRQAREGRAQSHSPRRSPGGPARRRARPVDAGRLRSRSAPTPSARTRAPATICSKLIGRRRTRLRKRALKLGARLYKRSPDRFTRRLRSAFSS